MAMQMQTGLVTQTHADCWVQMSFTSTVVPFCGTASSNKAWPRLLVKLSLCQSAQQAKMHNTFVVYLQALECINPARLQSTRTTAPVAWCQKMLSPNHGQGILTLLNTMFATSYVPTWFVSLTALRQLCPQIWWPRLSQFRQHTDTVLGYTIPSAPPLPASLPPWHASGYWTMCY